MSANAKKHFTDLTVTAVDKICQILRYPSAEGAHGRMIINKVILAMDTLRRRWSITTSTFLSPSVLQAAKLPSSLSLSDMKTSETFFNLIEKEYVD